MSVIRAFIAVNLSAQVRQCLEDVAQQAKSRLPGKAVRWVAVNNIHLTIKFLGDVSIANLELLKQVLQVEVARYPEFDFEVAGLGAFPSNRRPRVLWVGVQAPPELSTLQRGVENELARLGYAAEERDFSPHLTLGRVSRTSTPEEIRRIGDVLQNFTIGSLGTTHVKEVHLYRSDLQPGGAVYTRLFSAPLTGKPAAL
jgi:2'-5' RNA ligase